MVTYSPRGVMGRCEYFSHASPTTGVYTNGNTCCAWSMRSYPPPTRRVRRLNPSTHFRDTPPLPEKTPQRHLIAQRELGPGRTRIHGFPPSPFAGKPWTRVSRGNPLPAAISQPQGQLLKTPSPSHWIRVQGRHGTGAFVTHLVEGGGVLCLQPAQVQVAMQVGGQCVQPAQLRRHGSVHRRAGQLQRGRECRSSASCTGWSLPTQ
jgi:hypothetical protein